MRQRSVESEPNRSQIGGDRPLGSDRSDSFNGMFENQEPRTEAADRHESLFLACRAVGDALGIAIHTYSSSRPDTEPHDQLKAIARASRVRMRRVALRGAWWQADNGPLLAFVEQHNRPVALLPVSSGKYQLCDPVTDTRTSVTPEIAATLAPFAYTFIRPFPERTITVLEMLKFGVRGCRSDLGTVLLMSVAVGLLGLMTPIVAGAIYDAIIPNGERGQLLQLILVLVVAGVATAMFQLVRSTALLRLETRIGSSIQVALWDRLLSLPVHFFRQHAAGSLAVKALGINRIRYILASTTLSSVLAGLFSALNLGLLFFYDRSLALLAAALLFGGMLATIVVSSIQLRYERSIFAAETKIAGLVLQFITGISKLRVAGAEPRIFEVWAKQFARQRALEFKARTVTNGLAVFNAVFPLLSTMALFVAVGLTSGGARSTGAFLAFMLAFGNLSAAMVTLSWDVLSILKIVPIFEQARPILQTSPEVDAVKQDPGELRGEILLRDVSFRYHADGPLILKNISLHAKPGELVAIVGPSGSGKSTILRLLLGFETPEQGSIQYDGQDSATLDSHAVRRQMGVVLQNSSLMTGTILTNIVGASSLTVDDAWRAAARAGLDQDIKQMPMGMYTVITEASSTFSGGQRQRLLIARALIANPQIVLFDEATSALDNRAQAIVRTSLENLRATRIVIAHRLSTIMQADRIYVVHAGSIVQSGTYQELAEQAGLFRDMIERQIV